tara:strand:+ start:261 stop:2366 length:2106 start_codon:yes stop_codon:yes gene_type:complete
MAFVSSASSVYLDVHLTNYGRGVVLTGDLKTRVSKFSLSDTDIDYRQPISTGHTVTSQGGLIPGVTGNHVNCSSGVNDGFLCSSYIHQVATPIDPGKKASQVVVGIDKDLTGIKTYYSDVDVEVYIHDYYALCKLLSHIYAEDHELLYGHLLGGGSSTATELQNAFLTSFSASSQIQSGTWTKQTIKTALEIVNGKHRGQFIDFWDDIKVYYPNLGFTEEQVSITSSDQTYMNNAAAVTGRVSLTTDSCNSTVYDTEQKGYKSGLLNKIKGNNGGVSTSPFTLAFSNGSEGKKGAGPAGIGFTTTEFGYLVLGGGVDWGTTSGYKYYPSTFPDYNAAGNINYDTKKYFLGFVHPVEFENAPELDNTAQSSTGRRVPIKGYDEQDVETRFTYAKVKTVLPTLKYGITIPPNNQTNPGDENIKLAQSYQQTHLSDNQQQYSNYYYPIIESRATTIKEVFDLSSYSWGANTTIPEYHQSTYTDNALDTFALLGTNFEYTNVTKTVNKTGVDGQTVPSVERLFNINSQDIRVGKHYYNWFSRMMITGDEFLRAVYKNYNRGNSSFPTITTQFSARTGTSDTAEELDDFNVKIPLEFKIYSEENNKAMPATCTVTLVYNKRAVQQSIGYSGFSDFTSVDPNVPYWRIYDRVLSSGSYGDRKPRFYGEDGENITSYTCDPTQVSTDGTLTTGKRIFRKVLAGGTVIQ